LQSRKVKLRFLSTMANAVDRYERTIEVSKGATVRDLLKTISATYDEDVVGYVLEEDHVTIRNDVLILVNDTDIGALNGADTILLDDDEVTFMPISHGG
jgi:molybdopterin converting factor small subunit